MEHLHFIRPLWFFALPLAALWLWLLWCRQRGDGGWGQAVDPHLFDAMLAGRSATTRWPLTALALAAVLAVLALAGPSWQRSEVSTQRDGGASVFLLDMSLSMDATDLRPDRMTQARLKLLDMLAASQQGAVALIGFAAYPYTLAPLTDDVRTLQLITPTIQTNMAPAQGADIHAALQRGADILEQAFVKHGHLVLISDSEPTPGAVAFAKSLARRGVRTSAVSVGGDDAVVVPHGLGTLKDRSGQDVVALPAHRSLRELARSGQGEFVALTSGAVPVESVLQHADAAVAPGEDTGVVILWRDDGAWLLWALLLPLAVLCRRGLLW